MESQKQQYIIDDIKEVMQFEVDKKCIRASALLKDGRLALMKTDTSIHIYNPKNNFKEDCSTQSGTIPEDFKKNYEGSLCILENGNLLSFYCTDVIDIYSITDNSITKIHSISISPYIANRQCGIFLEPLSKNRFAFSVYYKNEEKETFILYIWKGESPYQNKPINQIETQEIIESYYQIKGNNKLLVVLSPRNQVRFLDIEDDVELVDIISLDDTYDMCDFLQIDDNTLLIGQYKIDLEENERERNFDSEKITDYFYYESSFEYYIKLRDNKILVTDGKRNDDYPPGVGPYIVYNLRLIDPFKPINENLLGNKEMNLGHLMVIDQNTFISYTNTTIKVFKY